MSTVLPERPLNFRRIADDHGLTTHDVRVLVEYHGMPTYRLGNSRLLMNPADYPRLRRILRRHIRAKVTAAPA